MFHGFVAVVEFFIGAGYKPLSPNVKEGSEEHKAAQRVRGYVFKAFMKVGEFESKEAAYTSQSQTSAGQKVSQRQKIIATRLGSRKEEVNKVLKKLKEDRAAAQAAAAQAAGP